MNISQRPSGLLVANTPPTEAERLAERQAIMEAYYGEHCRCPVCASDDVPRTTAGGIFLHPPYSDHNRAWCDDCGWKGEVHDLRPDSWEGTRVVKPDTNIALTTEEKS